MAVADVILGWPEHGVAAIRPRSVAGCSDCAIRDVVDWPPGVRRAATCSHRPPGSTAGPAGGDPLGPRRSCPPHGSSPSAVRMPE